MKKSIIIASLMLGSAMAGYSQVSRTPGDRLDAYSDAETFRSIMIDNIRRITYAGNAEDGYTHLVVNTYDGQELRLPIASASSILYTPVNTTPYEIKVIQGQNAEFRMLYNHNKPDMPDAIDPTKPYGWRGGKATDPVFYKVAPEKGYGATYTVTGQFTGMDYSKIADFILEADGDFTAQFGLGVDCLWYTMPFEPVTMEMTSYELDDYADLPILGGYFGTWVHANGSSLRTGRADAAIEFKANTTFVISTSESEPINLIDCYTYDAERSFFDHVPDPDDAAKVNTKLKVNWGMSGTFAEDGILYADAEYIPSPILENNRHYIFMPQECSFSVANVDVYGFRTLVELIPDNGDAKYVYYEDYAANHTPVSMRFVKGAKLSDSDVEAYMVSNGETILQYVRTDGADPVLKLKSAEAGTYAYTGAGSHSDLVLDGFGNATIDNITCPYTISGGIVTIALPSGSFEVVIDKDNHTYADKVDEEWNGAKMFRSTKVKGSYRGGAVADNCIVTLKLDEYVNGTSAPGYAAVIVEIPQGNGTTQKAIESGGDYIYDAAASTITVTNVSSYIYTADGWSYGRRNMTFHVSADKKSAYFGTEVFGDRLYSISRDASYILLGEENATIYANGEE